jgi:GT2 family glycosyltransferase
VSPGAGSAVDVVVVASGGDELAIECLQSLRDGNQGALSVTLVDNVSPERIDERVRELFPQVRVIRLETEVGYPRACNIGAEAGDAGLVLFLNDDVVATDGAIEELRHALSAGDAVAAGGRLVDPDDGSTQLPYRPKRFPTVASLSAELLGLAKLWPSNPITRRRSGAELDDQTTVPVEQPAGACVMIRRSEFDAIGGFDDRYWFWYDDVDLARRLTERGEVLYVPAAAFRHVGGARLGLWDRANVVLTRFTGMLRYAHKHFSRAQRAGLGAVVVLVSLPRALAFAIPRPAVGRAWWAVTKGGARLARGAAPGRLE